MMYYKIVERHPDGIRTLFHAYDGSRLLRTGVWLKADQKMVRDGSKGRWYLSGWHVLKSREEAVKFLNQKFRKRKEFLYVIPCQAKNLRPKPSNPVVFLADEIKIDKS